MLSDNFPEQEHLVVLALVEHIKPAFLQQDLICILPKTSVLGMSLLSLQRFICFHCLQMPPDERSRRKYPASGEAAVLNTSWCGSEIDFWEWRSREGVLGVQILLPLPCPSSHPPGFHGCFSPHCPESCGKHLSASLWRAAPPLPDGCRALGRIWEWMEFRGCLQGSTARLSAFLCSWKFIIDSSAELHLARSDCDQGRAVPGRGRWGEQGWDGVTGGCQGDAGLLPGVSHGSKELGSAE